MLGWAPYAHHPKDDTRNYSEVHSQSHSLLHSCEEIFFPATSTVTCDRPAPLTEQRDCLTQLRTPPLKSFQCHSIFQVFKNHLDFVKIYILMAQVKGEVCYTFLTSSKMRRGQPRLLSRISWEAFEAITARCHPRPTESDSLAVKPGESEF